MRSEALPLVKRDQARGPAGIGGFPAEGLSRFAVLARASASPRLAAPRVRVFNMGC